MFCTIYVKEIIRWNFISELTDDFLCIGEMAEKKSQIYLYMKKSQVDPTTVKATGNKRSSSHRKIHLDPTVWQEKWIHRPKIGHFDLLLPNPIEQEIWKLSWLIKGMFLSKVK